MDGAILVVGGCGEIVVGAALPDTGAEGLNPAYFYERPAIFVPTSYTGGTDEGGPHTIVRTVATHLEVNPFAQLKMVSFS